MNRMKYKHWSTDHRWDRWPNEGYQMSGGKSEQRKTCDYWKYKQTLTRDSDTQGLTLVYSLSTVASDFPKLLVT